MSQFTQKYTLVQFFDDIEEGAEYASSDWPLHSTIIDTFAINWPVDEIATQLTALLARYPKVDSVAEGDTYFGDHEQIQVTLLRRTESLTKLHEDVLEVLKDGRIALNDPQFAHDGFLPHVTVQKSARLYAGDNVQFTALSIIDMFPDGDAYKRNVLRTISIGHSLT